MRPDSLVGHEFFLAFTGTTPEFRAWEGLTALLELTADRYSVRFLTTHPEVPPEQRGRWPPGATGGDTLGWSPRERGVRVRLRRLESRHLREQTGAGGRAGARYLS